TCRRSRHCRWRFSWSPWCRSSSSTRSCSATSQRAYSPVLSRGDSANRLHTCSSPTISGYDRQTGLQVPPTHVCFDNPYPDPKSGGLPMRTTLLSLGAIATLVAPLLGGAPADGTDPEWPEETDGVVVFDRDTEGFQCFRIPAIVEAPDGSLIAFAEARRPLGDSFCHDDGSIDLVMRRSNDGGRKIGRAHV